MIDCIESCFFLNQKLHNLNTFHCIDCTTGRAASRVIFCFLKRNIQWSKHETQKWHISMCYAPTINFETWTKRFLECYPIYLPYNKR
jgi:hypothetical protein